MDADSKYKNSEMELTNCDRELTYYNYLRKSQCTLVKSPFGKLIPADDYACKTTLHEMDQLAKDCLVHHRLGSGTKNKK